MHCRRVDDALRQRVRQKSSPTPGGSSSLLMKSASERSSYVARSQRSVHWPTQPHLGTLRTQLRRQDRVPVFLRPDCLHGRRIDRLDDVWPSDIRASAMVTGLTGRRSAATSASTEAGSSGLKGNRMPSQRLGSGFRPIKAGRPNTSWYRPPPAAPPQSPMERTQSWTASADPESDSGLSLPAPAPQRAGCVNRPRFPQRSR